MNGSLRLAVIDSGVSSSVKFEKNQFSGYAAIYDDQTMTYNIVRDECRDEIGHGTAIANIFNKNASGISIDMFKLFGNEFEVSEEVLLAILEYISMNNVYDILHISAGIIQPDNYESLYSVCKKIHEAGTVIVAAFDNMGAVSYPAAFPFVIGVDLSENQLALTEYEFVENSIINIRASALFHRLLWVSPPMMLAQGTSFSSVYITLKIIELYKNGYRGYENILYELRKQAVRIYSNKECEKNDNAFASEISKAIVFPFNKEMHSLARFENDLKFEIMAYCDSKYSLNIGKRIDKIIDDVENDSVIQDINTIDWNDNFDTVILGHCDKLNALAKFNYTEFIVSKCKQFGKRIYSLDKVSNCEYDKIYYPAATLEMVPKNRFGKLRCISKPVLGVWGTSSQQGKFTLQITLRNMFKDAGYKAGLLSTEPQGPLLGADRVFPVGYNSTVEIHGIQSVTLLNEYMWEIACMDYDLILAGSQSGTVPFSYNHLSLFPLYQYDFLLGTQPDFFILCVNPHDEFDYILRTIKFLEGSVDSKVIALAVFPVKQIYTGIGLKYKKQKMTKEEMNTLIEKLESAFAIRAFSLGNKIHMQCLFDLIIDTLTRG